MLTVISFSPWKLPGFWLRTSRPTGWRGNKFSGQILVTSRGSKLNLCSSAGSIVWMKSVHSGYSPDSMWSYKSWLAWLWLLPPTWIASSSSKFLSPAGDKDQDTGSVKKKHSTNICKWMQCKSRSPYSDSPCFRLKVKCVSNLTQWTMRAILWGYDMEDVIYTCFGKPVEFDIGDLALSTDEGVCVHSKSRHLSVVGWYTNIVHQEGELHNVQKSQLRSSQGKSHPAKRSDNMFSTSQRKGCHFTAAMKYSRLTC